MNSLGKIKYDDYGYPNTNIQKAIKLADTKYFLKIDASIENNNTESKKNEDIFKPKVKITLSIYNKYGFLPLGTSESSATTENAVRISPEFISGMNFVDASILKSQIQKRWQISIVKQFYKLFYNSNIKAINDMIYVF